jgi:type I restriction enzyme R subunit
MCADLFQRLCENGGPEQKVIIFCTRDIHADRVAQQMNNLYAAGARKNGQSPRTTTPSSAPPGRRRLIEPMRGSASAPSSPAPWTCWKPAWTSSA